MIAKRDFQTAAERLMSWGVFITLLVTYCLTVPPTVSFWDCPEYVAAAWKLEIGHPPGNPLWMLVERVLTSPLPDGRYAALVINLSSGLFTALAAMLLAKSVFIAYLWCFGLRRRRVDIVSAAGAGLVAALCFGWCDSAWYSAVEAEVYAMSVFLTALTVWIAIKGATADSPASVRRHFLLVAYLTGLSLGVHQLNLLALPAVAVIFLSRHLRRSWGRLCAVTILSLIAVGCVLLGMMPSTAYFCGEIELFAVNTFGLPFNSGIIIYLILLTLSALLAIVVTNRDASPMATALSILPLLFLSGLLTFSRHAILGLILSILVAVAIAFAGCKRRLLPSMFSWSVTLLIIGYSVYLLVPVRGGIPSPANGSLPSDPFSFYSYLSREQYGSKPLLYGPTPYSRRMAVERFRADSVPDYSLLYMERKYPVYAPAKPGARLKKSNYLDKKDSLFNAGVLAKMEGDRRPGYLVSSYHLQPEYTPELNMWLPRITGQRPADIEAYGEWLGMYPSTMREVEISEAFDSVGNPVAKLGIDGERRHKTSYRPTYTQNFTWLVSYQIYYMYLRYLMWNFSGRQNDVPSTGEVDHGNFITGITAVDNLMLGAEEALPPDEGRDNPGHNVYFMLPFILGLAGLFYLLSGSHRSCRVSLIISALFIMTGVAIVIYLNQSPGEPRERDYSFLGSFMAFSAWIGFGGAALANWLSSLFRPIYRRNQQVAPIVRALSFLPAIGVAILMLCQNYDDHDRSGRVAARVIGTNILNSLEPNAILFVDGDNFTFPLWYLQEVEDVRPDVRVVNIAYTSLPSYVAALSNDWNESKGLDMSATPADILYGACGNLKISPEAADTMDATEAFSRFYREKLTSFPAKTLNFRIGENTANVDLRQLMRDNNTSTIPFRRLMMLDIAASALSSPEPRPLYWLQSAPGTAFAGLREYAEYMLLGFRIGPAVNSDSLVMSKASQLLNPNPGSATYIDHAPETQILLQCAAVVAAAKTLLNRGNQEDAFRLTLLADSLYGQSTRRYGVVHHADSTLNVAKTMSGILISVGEEYGDSLAVKRGESVRNSEFLRKKRRQLYLKSLPERLKDKVSK